MADIPEPSPPPAPAPGGQSPPVKASIPVSSPPAVRAGTIADGRTRPAPALGGARPVAGASGDAAQPTGKQKTASVLTDVATGAASGAITGGGLPGAAAGAGKALLRNKHSRKLIIIAVLIPVFAFVVVIALAVLAATSALMTATGTDRQASDVSAVSAGQKQPDVDTWMNATDNTGVQWTVALAVDQQSSMGSGGTRTDNIHRLGQDISQAGLDLAHSDVAAGGTWASDGRSMGTTDEEVTTATDNQGLFVKAFTLYGLSAPQAQTAFAQARSWELGQLQGCGAASGTVTTAGSGTAGASGGGGIALNAAQTANAATIIGIAKRVFPAAEAQQAALFGIATALQESSLVNLDHGDNAINPDGSVADSLGLFQQQGSWGTAAQRLDAAYAAGKFFQRWVADFGLTGWEANSVADVVAKVQVPAASTLPRYTAKLPLAQNVITALFASSPAVAVPAAVGEISGKTGTGTAPAAVGAQACGDLSAGSISSNDQTLAKALVAAIGNGTLTFWYEFGPSASDDAQQITWVAEGVSQPNCAVHTGVLQVITLALQMFGSVQVTDLNRLCDGTVYRGVGFLGDPHSGQGGGWAVDFGRFGSQANNGSNANDIKFLSALNALPTTGGQFEAGQSECRTGLSLNHMNQFSDSCTHQHIDTTIGHNTVITGGGAP